MTLIPLSDGGDGFLQLLASNLSLSLHPVPGIVGPLGARQPPLTAHFAASEDRSLAVIEMASASGLALLPQGAPLDVAHATTYGVGQLMTAAYNHGARQIIVGLGGSATNDGGLGALQALGLQIFLDSSERPIDAASGEYACGDMMHRISRLVMPRPELLPGLRLKLACDVTNPFVGPRGAVAVFSAQKGATDPLLREQLENGMLHVSKLYAQLPPCRDVSELPGSGAAGGIAGGLSAALDAQIVRGMDLMSDCLHLEDQISKHDLIITGEGAFDASTDDGKVVSHILELSSKYHKPVIIVCGNSTHPSPPVPVFPLLSMFELETAMKNPYQCLQDLTLSSHSKWFEIYQTSKQ